MEYGRLGGLYAGGVVLLPLSALVVLQGASDNQNPILDFGLQEIKFVGLSVHAYISLGFCMYPLIAWIEYCCTFHLNAVWSVYIQVNR